MRFFYNMAMRSIAAFTLATVCGVASASAEDLPSLRFGMPSVVSADIGIACDNRGPTVTLESGDIDHPPTRIAEGCDDSRISSNADGLPIVKLPCQSRCETLLDTPMAAKKSDTSGVRNVQ